MATIIFGDCSVELAATFTNGRSCGVDVFVVFVLVLVFIVVAGAGVDLHVQRFGMI